MELQRVLPSNAPALPEDVAGLLSTATESNQTLSSEISQNYTSNDNASCWRCKQHGHSTTDCECGVLRVSSGNVGSSVFQLRNTDLKTVNTQKYEFRPVSSLNDPPHHSAQAAIKGGHPRRRQQLPWSSLKGPPWYLHVEFETPRYRAYREKIREKGSKDGTWSDRVEEAFQMGIRIFRRRGRKKYDLNGKASGGNEFIAEFILQETGEVRDRKKVSSHIQVLKKFLKDNKAWMSLVANIEPEKSNKKARGGRAHEKAACSYEDSEYDGGFNHQSSQASCPPFPNRLSAPVESLDSKSCKSPTIRRVSDFSMVLEDNDSDVLHHQYTSLQSEMPSAPRALADVNKWREMYPALAAYHDRGSVDCPIYLFDTRLSLMDHIIKSSLGIRFSIDFCQGAHFTEWRSCLKFYKQNGCAVDLPESADILESEQVGGTDDSRLPKIPFRSRWWSRILTEMISDSKNTMTEEEEQRASRDIQGLSVMQEIWAAHGTFNRGPQRMAILLWRFDTARRGVAATTSWRRLFAPSSAYDVQSPYPPSEKPPMNLDTTLQLTSPYAAHHLIQPSIFSEISTGALLTAPLSENSSPSTTPTHQSRSFSSSVSNSTYPLSTSQESCFQPQDPAYPSLGGFDSQDSGYSLYEQHEIVETSHESYKSHDFADGSHESYESQETGYHSQDSLYQQMPDQLYEYPYQAVATQVVASGSQEFTGAHIQSSYTQTEDSHSPFEAPLMAPQPSMITQHQLIQHLEHFDQHEHLDQNPGDPADGRHEFDEQPDAQRLPQIYELNGLTLDYNALEEALRLHPDLEYHLSINTIGETGHIEQQCTSTPDQVAAESLQGEVVGEVGDEITLDRLLEYQ